MTEVINQVPQKKEVQPPLFDENGKPSKEVLKAQQEENNKEYLKYIEHLEENAEERRKNHAP